MDSSVVVFKNSAGLELNCLIRYENAIVNKIYNSSESYTTEQLKVSLFNLDNFRNLVEITGDAHYNQNRLIHKTLSCVLLSDDPEYNTSVFLSLSTQNTVPGIPANYFKEKIILNQTFKNVYCAGTKQKYVWNELAYNSSEGVVAFKDGNSEYWVFDRFMIR